MTKLHMSEKSKIVIIGSINGDISFFVKDFPAPNETILAKNSLLTTGGKGLNQAVAAARAGAQTVMIGCVGDDLFGQKAVDYLKQNHIAINTLKTVPNTPTGSAGILVSDAGDNMIAVSPGANADLLPADIIARKTEIEAANMLVVQMEIPPDTVKCALQIAANAGVPTLFNPAPATAQSQALIAFADIVSPNESETETITGIYPRDGASALAAAKQLCALGAKSVVITMGEAGYFTYAQDDNNGELCQAFAVGAIDPTGAGDVFNGVLARALAGGIALPEAARTASAAAALSVTKAGAEGAAPDWSQIRDFLRQQ